MNIDLTEIRRKTSIVSDYIENLEQPIRDKYVARKQTYKLRHDSIQELRKLVNEFLIVAFSASWCKDCADQVPVLALIAETTGLEVRLFGGLKKDPLSHTGKWRIPPSPPEVTAFEVDKIPLMIVYDLCGQEIGRIVERPKLTPTLEQELLEIVKSRQH